MKAPSGLIAHSTTGSECPCWVGRSRILHASHTFWVELSRILRASHTLVPSPPVEIMRELSGEIAQSLTVSVWPTRVACSCHVLVSHNFNVRSPPAETMKEPSGLNTQTFISASWLSSLVRTLQ